MARGACVARLARLRLRLRLRLMLRVRPRVNPNPHATANSNPNQALAPSHMPSSPLFHPSTTSLEPSLNLNGVEPVWNEEANIFLVPARSKEAGQSRRRVSRRFVHDPCTLHGYRHVPPPTANAKVQ